jgi:hypothetical protein
MRPQYDTTHDEVKGEYMYIEIVCVLCLRISAPTTTVPKGFGRGPCGPHGNPLGEVPGMSEARTARPG